MKVNLVLGAHPPGTQNVIHLFILIHCPLYSLSTAKVNDSKLIFSK